MDKSTVSLRSSSLANDCRRMLHKKGLLFSISADLQLIQLDLERVIAILQTLIEHEETEIVCAGFHRHGPGVLYVRIYVDNETMNEREIRGNSSPFWHDVCGVFIQCTLLEALVEVAKNFSSAGSKGGTEGLEWVCFKSNCPPNHFPALSRVIRGLAEN